MEPLTVAGNLNSIEKLVNYVIKAASQAGLNHRATYCLRLAVDEIATNIITYGYQAAGLTGELEVSAVFKPNRLIIELKDSGRPFDPRQVPPPPNLKQPLNKRDAGNLGIFLAMWGVDGFQYEQTRSHNRNIFIMHHTAEKAHS